MVVVHLITAEPMSPADASARRTAASLRIPSSVATATSSLAVYGPSAPVRRFLIASAGLDRKRSPFAGAPFPWTGDCLDLGLFDRAAESRVPWSRLNTSSSQPMTVGMVLAR